MITETPGQIFADDEAPESAAKANEFVVSTSGHNVRHIHMASLEFACILYNVYIYICIYIYLSCILFTILDSYSNVV